MELLLPEGIASEDAIIVLAALAAVITVVTAWYGLIARPISGRRVREIAARREELRKGIMAPARRRQRITAASFMRRTVQHLNLQRSARAEAMTLKLARAGWRQNDALVAYLFFKVTMPLIVGIDAFGVFYLAGAYDLPPMARLGAVIAGVLLGWIAPDTFVKNAVSKRRDKLRKALPDALDLMVICAEAGLSLDAMMKRVSEEFTRATPELADELGLTSLELGFLPDRREALKNLGLRCDQPGVRGVVNALLQSERYGTPLAQTLRVLSHEYREDRMMKAEEKAARLPALLTVPMILFILPPLFIVLIGPAILRTMDAFNNL